MDADISTWIELVNTTAFPIAMCLILLWLVSKVLKDLRDTLVSLEKTIERNTEVIEGVAREVENKPNV